MGYIKGYINPINHYTPKGIKRKGLSLFYGALGMFWNCKK